MHLLFDHFQSTLIHGPNIPGCYAILFFIASDFAFTSKLCFHLQTTGHCFCFGSGFSFLLELFLCSFPVAYWAPTYLGSSSFSVLSFCFFILFMGFSWHPFNISEHLFSGYLARLFLHEFLKYCSPRKNTHSLLYRLHEPLASENFTDGPHIAVSDPEVSWAKPQNSTAT